MWGTARAKARSFFCAKFQTTVAMWRLRRVPGDRSGERDSSPRDARVAADSSPRTLRVAAAARHLKGTTNVC